MANKQPRGVRNHNPGNIEHNPRNKWQGLANPPVEPEGRFARFTDPTYGIRALARTLITYFDKHDCNTVRLIVSRWAPAQENNTLAYSKALCAALDSRPDELLDLHDYHTLRPLVAAIIKHENGVQPYTDAQIEKGLLMAGVEPPRKALSRTKEIKASTALIATGAAATTAGVAQQVADAAPAVSVVGQVAEAAHDHPSGLLITFGLIVIAAALFIAWNRYADRQKGIR